MHLRKLQSISDAVKIMNQKLQDKMKPFVINTDCPPSYFEKEAKKTTTKSKSLIIADSIVRGLRSRNIRPNVVIDVKPGKKIADICRKLDSTTMDEYHTVIMYDGVNDAFVRTPLDVIYRNVKTTVELLRQSDCKVNVCTICPRRNGNVNPVNDVLTRICSETGRAFFLDAHNTFVYGDGNAVHRFYNSDGIYLSDVGQTKLKKCIETAISIVDTPNITTNFPSKANAKGDVDKGIDPTRHSFKNAQPSINSKTDGTWNCGPRQKQYGSAHPPVILLVTSSDTTGRADSRMLLPHPPLPQPVTLSGTMDRAGSSIVLPHQPNTLLLTSTDITVRADSITVVPIH